MPLCKLKGRDMTAQESHRVLAAGAQRRPKPGNNRPPRFGQQLIRGGGLSAAHLLVVHGANIAAADFSGKAPSFGAAQNGLQSPAEWLNAVATWSPLRI